MSNSQTEAEATSANTQGAQNNQNQLGHLGAVNPSPLEIKRHAAVLAFPQLLFVLVPALAVLFASLVIWNSPLPMSLAVAGFALLSLAVFFATRMLFRGAIILNMLLIGLVYLGVMLRLLAYIWVNLFGDDSIALNFDFSSLVALLVLAVLLMFAAYLLWYPTLMFYRHVLLRSLWLLGKLPLKSQHTAK